MGKNIFFVLLVAVFVSGCAGALPEKPWSEFRDEQNATNQSVIDEVQEEVQVQEEENRGTEVRNTYLPGGVIRNNTSVGPASGGIEVHEENYRDEERLVITPFFGKESPLYNQGRRDEKRRARILKQHNERQRVVDLAREDALNGAPNYVGVSGKYFDLYLEEYERTVNSFQRRDQRRYHEDEYHRGQQDFRQKHPEYARAARLIDEIREQARQDAREGIFYPPADGRFVGEYKEAHHQEVEHLKKRYHHRNKQW
ncbi:MAG: hypothetical protein UR51_C0015G0005 [Candidatus Moranbacteria bacterium GW2011_GWF1_34_10]|nr:MAG: hypothetical protein UR51_C0015G0005 [Candidatus Moranbacteria bacterium GW2011_GWF1_34_10]